MLHYPVEDWLENIQSYLEREYIAMLRKKIGVMYNVSEDEANKIIAQSPMKKFLHDNTECVMHRPLREWAELVYENYKEDNVNE